MDGKIHDITADTIELSDLFRRAAQFTDNDLAEAIVKKTRELCNRLTYVELSGHNRAVGTSIQTCVSELAQLAKSAGLKSITLPFTINMPYGMWVKENVIKNCTYAVPVELRVGLYDKDLRGSGHIRANFNEKTILFGRFGEIGGVRGLVSATDDIKTVWDGEKQETVQKEFAFMYEI